MIGGKKIIVAGGGLGGLISAIRLNRAGFDCILIEKKKFPFHRVCGEYVSNETAAFLKREKLYPEKFHPSQITELQLSSVAGKSSITPLGLGGFGISRYTFDNHLLELARNEGVEIITNTEIESIKYNTVFSVTMQNRQLEADYVVGSFGKRSRIDVQLSRRFIKKRSPYVGVKYHVRTDHPANRIALHNFRGGYCGVSNIEEGKTNICYLTHRDPLKKSGSIETLEKNILFENRFLKELFGNADFLFSKPEVINEISFETKEPVYDHIFMVGDAAGMIAPLCGNGMAMAIHSAKLLTDLMISSRISSRAELEKAYATSWHKTFSKRLWVGRQIQHKLFGTEWGSNLSVSLAIHSKFITNSLIKMTHGKPF
jgi:menaquinone-9 beta-reductase